MNNLTRLVITGCWGSGKTHLSRAVEERLSYPLMQLDQLVFDRVPIHRSGGPKTKAVLRDSEERNELLRSFLSGDRWILEGVYGKLLKRALGTATCFVWIDRSMEECLAGIEERGAQMMTQYGRDLSPAQKEKMIERVRNYRTRDDHLGYKTHRQLFESFTGEKKRITSLGEMNQWLVSPEFLD